MPQLEEGWIYVWQVPLPLPTSAGNFSILKVGKTEPHMLLKRLYEQRLSWNKLLYSKTEAPNIHIPYLSNSFDESESEKVDEYLKTLKIADYEHLLFLAWISDENERSVDETERMIRSVIGLPLPQATILELITRYKSKTPTKPGQKKPAVPKPSQLGFTEYVLTSTEFIAGITTDVTRKIDFPKLEFATLSDLLKCHAKFSFQLHTDVECNIEGLKPKLALLEAAPNKKAKKASEKSKSAATKASATSDSEDD